MAGVNVFIKYSMFIFNFVLWLCGMLILAVAIWIRANIYNKEIVNSGDTEVSSNAPVNILIAAGAIIMILGFLGCWGAIKENRFMLLLYFIGLSLIMVLQVISGIMESSSKSKSESKLDRTLRENAKLLSETSERGKQFRKIMAEFQQENKCCGLFNGADDWGTNFEQIYETCKCSKPSDSCISYAGRNIHKQTCTPLIKDLVLNRSKMIIGTSFGVAVVEVLGLVFSMILYRQIGKK
ncbi:tetraspanin-8 [Sciurus carolinensis]|uniref:tetraspanin-8 n=1 Tax=Sciurus carolinensis TaxID=30640 RepID=UPI001FB43E30|nr:tetraspanin-8 [Sciurus carolinensis]